MSDSWTNASVLRFAGDRDPIEAILERTRVVAFDAAADGWSGPPYDPLALARHLGLRVVPRDSLSDARVLHDSDGPRIEYNPSQPKGRLRFSIAHEIAHTFFDDVSDKPRHRTGSGAVDQGNGDDWQLELLCNVAAAELLMPNLSLPFDSIDKEALDIELIMDLRRRFDVSTESILRRVVSGTSHQVACVATSRVSDDAEQEPAFRVDYVTKSRTWEAPLQRGDELLWTSLTACSAVGYTWKSDEGSDAEDVFHVQAVGVPPYPGRRFPRVMALVQPMTDEPGEWAQINYVTGDVTETPESEQPVVLVHVVSDSVREWGRYGLAGQLSKKYPRIASAYRNWTIASNDNLRLGRTHILDADKALTIASVVAQSGYGPSSEPRLRYEGLRDGLAEVRREAKRREAVVHMPRVGTGQGGAQWELVAEVVDAELCSHGVAVTVIAPPDRDQPPASGTTSAG